jgi:hypothetical protein
VSSCIVTDRPIVPLLAHTYNLRSRRRFDSLPRLHAVLELWCRVRVERDAPQSHHPPHQALGHPAAYKIIGNTSASYAPYRAGPSLRQSVKHSVVQLAQ